jgi:hypothetical protein
LSEGRDCIIVAINPPGWLTALLAGGLLALEPLLLLLLLTGLLL